MEAFDDVKSVGGVDLVGLDLSDRDALIHGFDQREGVVDEVPQAAQLCASEDVGKRHRLQCLVEGKPRNHHGECRGANGCRVTARHHDASHGDPAGGEVAGHGGKVGGHGQPISVCGLVAPMTVSASGDRAVSWVVPAIAMTFAEGMPAPLAWPPGLRSVSVVDHVIGIQHDKSTRG